MYMDLKTYQKRCRQPDVLDEEALLCTIQILEKTNPSIARILLSNFNAGPIDRPGLEPGMPIAHNFQFHLDIDQCRQVRDSVKGVSEGISQKDPVWANKHGAADLLLTKWVQIVLKREASAASA